MSTTFGSAAALGLPAFSGADNVILSYPAATPAQGYLVQPGAGAPMIGTYTLIFDLLIPAGAVGTYGGLLQTDPANGSDSDLFVKKLSATTAGLGINSQYDGSLTLGVWHRVALTVNDNGDGTSTLVKYIDGTKVGEQAMPTARFSIDQASGFLILTDNDGETFPGFLSSFAFVDNALAGGEIGALGGPDANGILKHQPAGAHAVEFGFDGGSLFPTLGSGTLTPKAMIPDLGAAVDQGVAEVPNDAGVLVFPAAAPAGGYLVDPGVSGAVTSYTMIFDVLIPADAPGTYGALFQTNLDNANDSDFFMKKTSATTFGVGISSQYDGSAALGAWHRVAVTLADNSNGTSTMTKFIDGALVGTQQVDTTRFTIGDNGLLILTDENGEAFPGHLNSLLFTDEAMPPQAIAELGGAAADGILALAPTTGHATQFDFDGASLEPTFGAGTMTDRTDIGSEPQELKLVNPLKDMMVTPDADNVTIDLAGVFEGVNLTYTVANSDGAVLTVVPSAAGTIELDFAALGHSDIKVTATDADGNSLSDYFRVRVAGPNAYTIAVLPDTQNYTSHPELNYIFFDMTQWLVDNKDSHNIQFVTHVGDITDDNLEHQWNVAEPALRQLDGVIPYSLLPGNHDQAVGGTAADHSSVYLDSRFSPDAQAAVSGTFGGVYDQELDRSANNYHTFTAPDGTKWLVLSMEFGPRDDVLRWATDVLDEHLDHRVMLLSHSLTNFAGQHDPLGAPIYDEGAGADYGMGNDPQGANDGETVYRQLLSKYPNITFTFSGHIFGDGAETNVVYSQYGTATYQMLVNYQNGVSREITGNGNEALGNRGGNGAMRLVTIDPDNNRITTETYFTEFDDYLDGYRMKPELDRDGLTGYYRGHQETFTDVDVGAPPVLAQARAGDDLFVDAAAGAKAALVTLDASGSLDPKHDIVSYEWLDGDGNVVATGAAPTVELDVGQHHLTLKVTDSEGQVTTDEVLAVVKGDSTLLVENFNDGNADGWVRPTQAGPTLVTVGAPADFGLPDLPGGSESVAKITALAPTEKLVLNPNLGAPAGFKIGDYSIIFDLLVPAAHSTFTALFPTNTANNDDGDLFIRDLGNGTGGIGISGNYQGSFAYGQWQRVAFTFHDNGDGSLTLVKYIQGVKVGEQSVSAERFSLDVGTGALLFSDEDGETSDLYVSSVLVTDHVYTEAEIATLGGAKAGGIVAAAPTPPSVQFDFNNATLAPTFGVASLTVGEGGPTGNFMVKGTVFARPDAEAGMPAPEGALYDQSDSASNMLIWDGDAAKTWHDYEMEVGIKSTDNDGVGVVFYYQDADNHYRLVLDAEHNSRSLVKVDGGVETVLATETGGYRFNADMSVKVAVVGNGITAFVDDHALFGGTVTDANPLAGGTVGFWSDTQRSSIFDNVTVNLVDLTAHAGDDQRIVDLDDNGSVQVTLDAGASFGIDAIASYIWKDADGNVVASGAKPVVTFAPGSHQLTLEVTDTDGTVATDTVTLEIVSKEAVLLHDAFDAPSISSHWTIVDEGEFGGLGTDGKASDWQIVDGKLTQTSDLQSRQLEWTGATAADLWDRGWSPLGDGVNVLRKGTYALYSAAEAAEWTDYSIETTFKTPDNDGLGIIFHYVDANNYYKLELDAEGDLDRNPSNGAGAVFQLLRLRNGLEEILGIVPGKYTPGDDTKLRVDIKDGEIFAYVDGMQIFGHGIEDHSLTQGTIAFYSWGNQGLQFDDVTVVSLELENQVIEGTDGVDVLAGGAGNDQIFGLAGDDILAGNAGDDVLDGEDGDDALAGGAGDDVLVGGDGDDTLKGGDGNDVLTGGDGDDDLDGGADDDVLAGSDGDDALKGGAGDDVLAGGNDDDVLAGEAGDDTLKGGAGDDVLEGGDGDDELDGGDGNDVLDGGTGNDELVGGGGDDTFNLHVGSQTTGVIDGGDGNDTINLLGIGIGALGSAVNVEILNVQGGTWSVADSASYTDIAIADGAIVTTEVTLSGTDTLTIAEGGTLSVDASNANAVSIVGPAKAVVIDNAGLVHSGPQSAHAIGGGFTGEEHSFTILNRASGVISAEWQAAIEFRSDFFDPGTGVVVLDNAGLIDGNNSQAVTFKDMEATSVTIYNREGGIITAVAGQDVLRPGEGRTTPIVVWNDGQIVSKANSPGEGGADAVDFQGSFFSLGGTVNNGATGLIEGSRHGITGKNEAVINNAAGGVIIGRNGSGINFDTEIDADDTAVIVTNHGLISGRYDGGDEGDGDGVDVDYLVTLHNYGRVEGAGADNQENFADGVAAGGGEIHNYAGATIYGESRGIFVDDSDLGDAFAATTVYNEGSVTSKLDAAIRFIGDWDDTIVNKGLIGSDSGIAIDMGGGDDTLLMEAGAVVLGAILGGAGDDTVNGAEGDEIVDGDAGDDALDGGGGDDVLDGGDGDDRLDGGDGDDTLDGGEGDDVLAGGGGDDTLDGDAGDDVLAGGADDDDLDGGEGDDVLAGDDGDDILKGAAGADVLDGGADDDQLDGGAGNDELDGGEGEDTLDGGTGDDTLKGGGGADLLLGGLGNDSLEGGADGDLFAFSAPMGHDVITDLASGDVIRFDRALFGDFEDLLSFAAQVGPDVVITLDGQNSLTLEGVTLGGLTAASFEFVGEGAPVHLVGTSGNDVLTGGAGNDSLAGGYGNDQLTGRAGDDVLDGGYGNDVLEGGSGQDTLKGGYGNDSLDGGSGDDGLDGGYGNDSLAAGAGNDSLAGGYGDDALDGGAGNDSLDGGYGNDSLAGGLGNDVLTGGRGSDAFVFAADFGKDKIADFGKYGDDVIEFDAALFADFNAVKAHAAQVGSDVVITFDQDDAITLVGVKLNTLHDDDFRFVA